MVGDPERRNGYFGPILTNRLWKCKAKLDTESREHGLGSVHE